jgi:EREBP-like factor
MRSEAQIELRCSSGTSSSPQTTVAGPSHPPEPPPRTSFPPLYRPCLLCDDAHEHAAAAREISGVHAAAHEVSGGIQRPPPRCQPCFRSYNSAEEAARAYDVAVRTLRGPLALTNFPVSLPLPLSFRRAPPSSPSAGPGRLEAGRSSARRQRRLLRPTPSSSARRLAPSSSARRPAPPPDAQLLRPTPAPCPARERPTASAGCHTTKAGAPRRRCSAQGPDCLFFLSTGTRLLFFLFRGI